MKKFDLKNLQGSKRTLRSGSSISSSSLRWPLSSSAAASVSHRPASTPASGAASQAKAACTPYSAARECTS